MHKIYIDSTQRNKKRVILYKNEKVIAEKSGDLTLDIVSSIRDLLIENKMSLKDIDVFEPNRGPGSFTGIKVAVTVANVFNWALGKKKKEELATPNYGAEPNIET